VSKLLVTFCLSAGKGIKDFLLKKRASNEHTIINNIKEKPTKRTYLIPNSLEEKLLPAILSICDKAIVVELWCKRIHFFS